MNESISGTSRHNKVKGICYMDLLLDFGEEYGHVGERLDESKFRSCIFSSLQVLFGDTGFAIPVGILKYKEANRRAHIFFPAKEMNKVWAAITLFSKYEDSDCAFRVFTVTPEKSKLGLL